MSSNSGTGNSGNPNLPPVREQGISPISFIASHELSYPAGKVIEFLILAKDSENPVELLESARYHVNLLIEQAKTRDPKYERKGKVRGRSLSRPWQEDTEKIAGIEDLSNPEEGTKKI